MQVSIMNYYVEIPIMNYCVERQIGCMLSGARYFKMASSALNNQRQLSPHPAVCGSSSESHAPVLCQIRERKAVRITTHTLPPAIPHRMGNAFPQPMPPKGFSLKPP